MTLNQELRALLRRFSISEILLQLSYITIADADNYAQDGEFLKEEESKRVSMAINDVIAYHPVSFQILERTKWE